MSTSVIVALAVVGFFVFWCFIVWLISAVGGWSSLAAHYRNELPFTGRTWSFRSGMMGGIARYNGALTVGVNPSGLYLSVLPLFRPGHPPLFIPWSDVTVGNEQRFLRSYIAFRFRQAPDTSLWLWERFGREVLETARGGPDRALQSQT